MSFEWLDRAGDEEYEPGPSPCDERQDEALERHLRLLESPSPYDSASRQNASGAIRAHVAKLRQRIAELEADGRQMAAQIMELQDEIDG